MICARCGAETAADACAACGGDPRLDGRYRLRSLLGQGTHGMTYRAEGPDGAPVAVKMVNLGAGLVGEKRAALDREVAVLRALDHPRIPAMLDDFTVRSGMTRYRCIVQTFVDGPDLASLVASRRPTVVEVVEWVGEIADVLGWLHRLAPPIIHRDIKPQNVLRRRSDGALVLIDFGSVRDSVVETLGGTMGIGTAGYMAPEQITGDVGPRSDIFSLGATAIELLTRTPPHSLRERGGRLVWPAAQFPRAVAAMVDRMIDPDPALRPDAAELRALATRVAADPEGAPLAPPQPSLRLAKVVGPVAPSPPIEPSPPVELEPAGPTTATEWMAAVRRQLAGRATMALTLVVVAALVGLIAAPFAAEITAWVALFATPLSLYLAWTGGRAGSRWAAGIGLTALGLIVSVTLAVNFFGIGPMDARTVSPTLLLPIYLIASRPVGLAYKQLAELREATTETLPLPGKTPLQRHHSALRWSWATGAAMVVAGLAAFEDIESFMISAPAAVVLGLWTFSRGRLAKLRPVQLLGLSLPLGALALWVALELFHVSYWEHRGLLAPLIMVFGVLVAMGSVYIGVKKWPLPEE